MSSAAASCATRPLSGVRVFLHIRRSSADEDVGWGNLSSSGIDCAKKRKRDSNRDSARDVLRTARAHAQQLGATLALSEATADLVVFHRGSASFLEAAHMKFKTVVRPDYLAACVAAEERVNIAPYVVTPTGSATATMCITPARKSAGISSAVPSSHTSASSPGNSRSAVSAADDIPNSTGRSTRSSRPAGRGAAAAPSSASTSSPSRATHSPLKSEAKTDTPAEGSTSPPLLYRLLLFDDNEDGAKADGQQRGPAALARMLTACEGGAVADTAASSSAPQVMPSTTTNSGTTKLYHLLDDMPNNKANAVRCAVRKPQRDGAGGQQRLDNSLTFHSSSNSSALTQERIIATRTKRGPHQTSTAAVGLDEVAARQSSTDTVSTPRLTPSSRHEVGSGGSQGVSAVMLPCRSRSSGNERIATAVERREADMEEEEMIRHTVLRSTATAAVTQRRERPPKQADSAPKPANTVSLLVGSVAGDQNAMAKRDRDPFLSSEGSTQQQLLPSVASTLSLGELSDGEMAITQPLATSPLKAFTAAAQPQTPSAVSRAPTGATAKRLRNSSRADGPTEGSAHHTHATPSAKAQGLRQRRIKQENAVDGAAHEKASKSRKQGQPQQQQKRQLCARQRRRVSNRGRAEVPSDLECTLTAESPFSMTFTDLALLCRLAAEDEGGGATASELCVHIFLDDVSDVNGDAASAASLSFFLRDVVEQLGAACDILGGDADSRGHSCWFGRQRRTRARRRPTHLVVSPRAALTPDILYCKAVGIPILTPQWLYDAIALGAFPSILPHVHAHPVYGDQHVGDAAVAVVGTSVTAACVPRRDGHLGAEEDNGDGGRGEAVWASAKVTLSSISSHSGGSAAVPRARTPAAAPEAQCPPRCGSSSTLRQLHKEVADEYIPAGEQALRPFYAPIFQDRMFYLYVPPLDLANASATGGNAGPLRARGVSHNSRSGSYLGDATAALTQVTELLRVLGGTVTRNVASTYLDLVIDLTGFYENMVELGLTTREQQGQTRPLRQSLSCAFQEALQRVSLRPVSLNGGAAATTPVAPPMAPPVVGIAWLIHSILTRRWTAADTFVLAGHPLAAQLAAMHLRARVDSTVAAGATASHEDATGSGAVAAPVVEDALVAAGAPAAMDTHTPPAPPSHDEAAESPSSSLWSAVMEEAAVSHLKKTRGPQSALKHTIHPLGTQEIATMLGDAQLQSLDVPDTVVPSTSAPAYPPQQPATTLLWVREEDSLSFARIQYSDGDCDNDVV
ncbi:hypothetical protein LPMP_251650 [Leishmania panamensis]|uniref:BRCT domain-containing protein n=1 Tax=Leishmania panamensis TaxID=5679 RepID=A0A088RSS2_LEIPA|nr:hypothetical protein LPMP_251650 [Leishmania panamensis]AIN99028.1 hypothetical protein LPMP_251650 [Leishmania panamensis]